MKYLKTFIIYSLSCLSIVIGMVNKDSHIKGNSTEEKELDDFFRQIRRMQNVTTREVLLGGNKISIKKFFLQSDMRIFSKSLYPVSSLPDATGFARLLSVVMSCEYSELLYFLVKVLQNVQEYIKAMHLKNKTRKERFSIITTDFYKPILKLLSPMILTLVDLLKKNNNVSTKHHEILTITLSWYIYITNVVEKGDKIDDGIDENQEFTRRLNSLIITTLQVEIYLKHFNLTNCRDIKSFIEYQMRVKNEAVLYQYDETKNVFKRKCDELNNIVYRKYSSEINNENTFFIFTADTHYSEKLIDIIKQHVSNQPVKIRWDGTTDEDISVVYEKYIAKNVNDIETILRFERIILQIITKFIVAYVSEILNDIVETTGDTYVVEMCNNMTIDLLDTHLQKFKRDGQPLYLINNMSIIRADLSTVCFKYETSVSENKSRMRKRAKQLKTSITEIPIKGNYYNGFVDFLESLSNTVICTKLHPSVSNAFWEKLYFVPTNVFEYIVDLKKLYTQILLEEKRNKSVCEGAINKTEETIKSVLNKTNECEKLINAESKTNAYDCFTELKNLYDKLKYYICDIGSQLNGVDDYNWRKLYFILYYAIDNNVSFDDNENDYDILYLKTVNVVVSDGFKFGSDITCTSIKSQPRMSCLGSLTKIRFRRNVKNNNNHIFDFFNSIRDYVDEIVKNPIIQQVAIRLYFDGVKMTLSEVHQMHKKNSIDQLQENYDYFRFLVRYIIAVVYYKINEIIDGIVSFEKNLPWSKEVEDEVESKFQLFMQLPLYIAMPVKPILDMFVLVLKTTKSENHFDLTKYQEVVHQEIENLGVDMTTFSTSENTNGPVLLNSLITTIDALTETYMNGKYKSRIENAVEHFGMDKNDRIMMFYEWYRQ